MSQLILIEERQSTVITVIHTLTARLHLESLKEALFLTPMASLMLLVFVLNSQIAVSFDVHLNSAIPDSNRVSKGTVAKMGVRHIKSKSKHKKYLSIFQTEFFFARKRELIYKDDDKGGGS